MPDNRPTLRHRAETLPLLLMVAALRRLPPRWASRFGSALGRFAFDVLRIRRGVTLHNLALAFGDRFSPAERTAIARRCFQSMGMAAIEFLVLPAIPRERLSHHMTIDNVEALREGLAGGRGVIISLGHFGNWEVAPPRLTDMGIPLSGYAGQQHNPVFDKLINDIRRAGGEEVISKGVVMRGLLQALKNNRALALVADQYDTHKRLYVSFFGRPVSAAPGPATIARRTGAPIVFFKSVREGLFRYRGSFRKMPYRVTDDEERDVLEITQSLFDALEEAIRENPDHYFWMHNRFRPIPPHVSLSPANRAFLLERLPADRLPPEPPESAAPATPGGAPGGAPDGPEHAAATSQPAGGASRP